MDTRCLNRGWLTTKEVRHMASPLDAPSPDAPPDGLYGHPPAAPPLACGITLGRSVYGYGGLGPDAGLPFQREGLEGGQSVRVSSVRFFGSDSDFFRDGGRPPVMQRGRWFAGPCPRYRGRAAGGRASVAATTPGRKAVTSPPVQGSSGRRRRRSPLRLPVRSPWT